MRAIVYKQYGPPEVLQFEEVAKPVPREGEILIRVMATTVHIGDTRFRKPDPFLVRLINGLFKPKKVTILGMELAGVVEEAGREVKRFRQGDPVFAFTGFGFGAYAEYKCMPESGHPKNGLVAFKPAGMSFEEAAALPGGGLTALYLVRKARIQPGQKVLVYGASGSVGTYAVQLARSLGAEVTGVCSTASLDLVRSLGAERVIDYTREDFTLGTERYDAIFDAVDKLPASRGKKALEKTGIYLNVARDSGSGNDLKTDDLIFLKEQVEAGKLRAVLDRCYPWEQVVEAHHYVDQGHKRGNVVIRVGSQEGNFQPRPG